MPACAIASALEVAYACGSSSRAMSGSRPERDELGRADREPAEREGGERERDDAAGVLHRVR